jgi:LysR family transcriptional regulator, glycine cleavage system transcriptional activator
MLMRPACQQPERAGCEFHMYSASKICIVERKGRRLKPEQQHLPWKDPGLTWSQLRAFEACARLSSFNAAAAELNLTASAVRHQAGLLEARIGVKLLERQGGRLSLTSTGTAFARQISRPMRDLVAACVNANRTAATAPITLTAPPLFARQFLFDRHFLKWCDDNQVRLDVTDAKRDLLTTDHIVAVRLDAEQDADLIATPILGVELVLAAAPSVAANARPSDSAWWTGQILLSPGVSDNAWPRVWRALKVPAPQTAPPLRFSSYAAALEAACAGHGVLLAPLPFSEREFAAGRLSRLSDIRLSSPIEYSLVMRRELALMPRGRSLQRRVFSAVRK